MSTRRLAESVEGLNSSLALAAGNLWPKKGQPIAVVKGLMLPKSSAFYTVLYADDTYLCLSHKNPDDSQRIVNVEKLK